MIVDLPNLTAKKDLEELVYHFKGIIEAADVIRGQMELLDSAVDSDLERATDALGRLTAELYTHLPYHLKQLRRPFLRFSRSLYKDLGDEAEDDPVEP
jgi:hypothetical protein